jgi:hypothetical protein
MGQILAKILSEKYGVIICFAVAVYVLNNWSSSSSSTPPSNPCSAGLTLCNTNCVNLQTDVNNCGSCGNILITTGIFGPTCVNGVGYCDASFPYCENSGCTDIFNDPSNCGGCGLSSQNSTCSNGNVICNQGYDACDTGIPCSINLEDDNNNCGTCGNVCGGFTPECVNGLCF